MNKGQTTLVLTKEHQKDHHMSIMQICCCQPLLLDLFWHANVDLNGLLALSDQYCSGFYFDEKFELHTQKSNYTEDENIAI